MAKYFISPAEFVDWHLAADDFVAALRRHWPEAKVHSAASDSHHSVELELPLEHSTAYASLNSTGDTVVMETDPRDAVTVAIWFRRVVPERIPLLLYDEGFNDRVSVTPSTTQEELEAMFLHVASTAG